VGSLLVAEQCHNFQSVVGFTDDQMMMMMMMMMMPEHLLSLTV